MTETGDSRLLQLAPAAAMPDAAETWTVPKGLTYDSSTSDRLRALMEMGLTTMQLRSVLSNCSDATLRNWLDGTTTPRDHALVLLDDLRAVVVALGHAGIRGPSATKWLFSRNFSRWIGGRRPIEMLAEQPLRLLAAVQDLVYPSEDVAPEEFHLCVAPESADLPVTEKRPTSKRTKPATTRTKPSRRRRAPSHEPA
jgi:hypothetical protein